MTQDKRPLVSIIIRCYNQAGFIAQAINSVVGQTYTNTEIIVVDDCSSDESRAVICRLLETNNSAKLIFNQTNQGGPRSLNLALRACAGKYVANLDGDDYWLSQNKITSQVDFLETHDDYNLVGTFVQNVDRSGRDLDSCQLPISDHKIKKELLSHNPIAASSVMFRQDIALKINGYPENRPTAEDIGFWLELGKTGKFYNLPKFWQAHRMTGLNIGEVRRQEQARDALYYILRNRNSYPGFYRAWLLHRLQIMLFGLPAWLINILRKLTGKKNEQDTYDKS